MKDAFISYAHLDDVPDEPGQPGWVERFHQNLETRLNKLWGRQSQVWRDPTLEGNQAFAATIEQQLRGVKTLLAIMTPRYLNSDWCRREILAFVKAAEATGGFQLGDRTRLFKVLKTPVLDDDLPKDLPRELIELHRNLLGYPFYDIDPQTKRPREYSHEFGEEAKQLYHAKVYDLATDLCRLLKQFDQQHATTGQSLGQSKTVYLAQGTADLQSAHDQIRARLIRGGHAVLPDRPLPWVATEARQVIREYLERSDLAIHLVGGFYGFIPEGAEDSIIAIQNAVAAGLSKTQGLRRLIWMPEGLAPEEGRQAAYVQFLHEDKDAQCGAEVLEVPLDQLEVVLLDRLKPPPPAEHVQRLSPEATGQAPLVYLIGDQQDRDALDPIDQFLYDGGVEVTRSYFGDNAADQAEAHQRRLLACDAALIYYGSTSREWVDMKLMDLKQAPGYGRDKEYRARAVCVAPPEDEGKQRFRSRLADVIRLQDRSDPAPLAAFLEQVGISA